jgi:hypothetical protein
MKEVLPDILAVTGYVMLFVGLWLIDPAWALVVGGAVMLVVGLLSAWLGRAGG